MIDRVWLCTLLLLGSMTTVAPTFGEVVRLAESPALSPDGAEIAFSWRGDLWIVASTGGTARQLTTHPGRDGQPLFSPDGTQLAFTSDRTGSRQAYVMPVTGGAARQLTWHTEGCLLVGWYPAGDALLASGARDHWHRNADRLFRVELDRRTAERPLFDDYASEASLSPDGQKVLFVREGERIWRQGYRGSRAGQIWQYDLNTKEFRKLIASGTEARFPRWKSDGSGFYYTGGLPCFNLHEYQFADDTSRPLTNFTVDSALELNVSRDGSTITWRRLADVYVWKPAAQEAPTKLAIEAVDDTAADPQIRRTLNQASSVSFTSDGLEMAFISGGDVWLMETELREPRQLTNTPDEERDPSFSPDHQRLIYISDVEGDPNLYEVTRNEPALPWWHNKSFVTKKLTSDSSMKREPRYSPDGKLIAYVRDRGDIWLMDASGENARRFQPGFTIPDYDFSPDSKWLAWSANDTDFNSEIWIAPIDGSRPPYNVSRHPDQDHEPRWSPDGKLLAFTGRHDEHDSDIYYVWLSQEEGDRSRRDRKLADALEKIRKVREKSEARPTTDSPRDHEKKLEGEGEKQPDAAKKKESAPVEVKIDFDRLADRVERIKLDHSAEANLVWSFDSKKLAFSATIDGKRGTATVEFPDQLTPKFLSATTGTNARWLKQGNTIYWLANHQPASLSAVGTLTTYGFSVPQTIDRGQRFRAGFDASWRTMRDHWYDPRLGNRNWDDVRRKYRDLAGSLQNVGELQDVIHLMLGELNGSHLGFAPFGGETAPNTGWKVQTAHLGVRFEPDDQGPGLKIRDVLPRGPAEREQSRLLVGELILQIDGVPVDPAYDLTQLLNGRLDREIALTVRNAQDQERQVLLRPITYAEARTLLYERWLDFNRKEVERLSEGKLGYLHIQAMNDASFLKFEQDLYRVGYGRDGLVIDVRDNGGGFTADHLLTALTQPVHAITVPRGGERGYPQDRKVYATWNKPIVVLCNQNSYSNAEIFSHAIKSLKRGKLVGVATAGGVISTGAVTIMDLGTLRLPFRGWFGASTGRDMELNGAVPDVTLWPLPGDLTAGRDLQLQRGIKVLQNAVRKAQSQPVPPLHYATEPEPETGAE